MIYEFERGQGIIEISSIGDVITERLDLQDVSTF
jgi:hypothetical protein